MYATRNAGLMLQKSPTHAFPFPRSVHMCVSSRHRVSTACARRGVSASWSAPPQLLESCFLVSAALVLMAGMVFSADGFNPGSIGYSLLTVLVSGVIVVATATFAVLLAFEVYRSVKYAEAHALARQVEEEAVEEALLGRTRRRAPSGAGTRSQSSIGSALKHGGRRLSVALGWSSPAPSPTRDGAVKASEGAAALPSDDGSMPQGRASVLFKSVVHLRRQSLLDRILGVAGAGGNGSSGMSRGISVPGGQLSDGLSGSVVQASEAPCSGHASRMRPLPPPPLGVPTPPGLEVLSSGSSFNPSPPPTPPSDDFGSPGALSSTLASVPAAVAARSKRVHTMVAKERGHATRVAHVPPGQDSSGGTTGTLSRNFQ
jgi:hypothetical protein